MAAISKSNMICSTLQLFLSFRSLGSVLSQFCSLSLISQRQTAIKSWIIENCFIFAMIIVMIHISMISDTIHGFTFYPFITNNRFRWGKMYFSEMFLSLHILNLFGHSWKMPLRYCCGILFYLVMLHSLLLK